MSKKLFIQTINSMVDFKTVFIAHPSYWSDVYDRIQRGLTERLGEITQIATTPVNLDDSIFSESKRVLDNN